MNVMSDQLNNHTDLVVKEMKEQKEQNKEFMQKVDFKLGQMKKELQEADFRACYSHTGAVMEQIDRQTEAITKFLKEKEAKRDRDVYSFNHNLMAQMKEQNDKVVSSICN